MELFSVKEPLKIRATSQMGAEGRSGTLCVCVCIWFSCLFLPFLCSLLCFLTGSVSPLSAFPLPDSCDCCNLFSLTSATFYAF